MGHELFRTRPAGGDPTSTFQSTVAQALMVDDTLPPGSGGPDSLPLDPATDFDTDLPIDETAVAAEPTLSHIGRYALKHPLAEGGLGTVYEAWDPLLSRAVAVKTLQFKVPLPSRVALDGLFLNEARTAAGLSHRYIVTVYDAGLSPHGVYIAMERLHGRDLRQALDAGWLPSPERAAQIVRRVADALAYAHGRGVVHCDIKPGNIFLTRRHRPKVLDFGIARAAGAAAPGLDGLLAGSPHYLAPEQLDGGEIDARTDIYSLGVVLYELLTGRKAFEGRSLEAITAAVRAGQPVPIRQLQPAVPEALAAIVERAMARSPADRPASAGELSQALRQWGTQQRAIASIEALSAPVRPAGAPPAGRGKAGWIVGGVLVAMLGGVLAMQGRRPAVADAPAPLPAVARVAAPAVPPTPAAAATAIVPADPAEADVRIGELPPPAAAMPSAAATASPRMPAPNSGAEPPRAPARTAAGNATVAASTGLVQLSVSPWAHLEVDGKEAGMTPPVSRLVLPAGTHTITLRNEDYAPHTVTLTVAPDRPATVRHQFAP